MADSISFGRFRTLGVVSVLVVGALVAAACSSGESSSSAPGPVDGGVLRLGIERPQQWRPIDASSVVQSELIAADLLFDGLSAWDAEAELAVPSLATSWSVDDAQQRWTFQLRSGATFSEGLPLTAGDVVATIEADKVADPSLLAAVAAVSAPSPDVVQIDLAIPMASLPELLASPRLGIVPSAASGTSVAAAGSLPYTSGPFQVEIGATDQLVVLSAAAGADLHLDGIELHLYDDEGAAYAGLEGGQVDWALVPGDVASDQVDGLDVAPFPAELFYGMNLADPVFADARFRQAVVRAVDRDAIATAVYGSALAPLSGVIVDGVAGHRDDACAGECSYDPAASRALVAEAFPGATPPALSIDFDDGTTERAVAQSIADDLAAVGITATLRPHSPEEYATFVASGQAQLFRFGWAGAYPSADAYLEALFRSTSSDDVTRLQDPAVDTLLDQARTTADPAARGDVFAEADAAVMAQFPLVPIGQYESRWVAGPTVNDLRLDITGSFRVSDVWLEQ